MKIIQNITHDLNIPTIVEDLSLDIDFIVEITEASDSDEGGVEIDFKYQYATRVEVQHLVEKFRDAVWNEINRLKDGDELIGIARAQHEEGAGEILRRPGA